MSENNHLSERIEELETLLDKYRVVFRSLHPHLGEHFFLCGKGGQEDQNGLPEFIEVCPAYGAGWSVTYQKTTRTHMTEGF